MMDESAETQHSDAPQSSAQAGPQTSDAAREQSDASLESLDQLLARLENDPVPRDDHDFRSPFSTLRQAIEARGDQPAEELIAEEIAFSIHAHARQSTSEWGLYFGPMMSGTFESGKAWEVPSLGSVTPGVMAHWRTRALESSHPVMRARYADLLWELPKKIEGVRPEPAMARVAVDAYLKAIEGRRHDHSVSAIAGAERALDLALSLGDADRVVRARDVLLALEDAVAEDDSLGLWGFCFDALLEPPNRRVPLTDAQRDKLVADMEARLARFAERPASAFHPSGAESAAVRLATYYRRRGSQDQVARVLRVYEGVVRRMRGTAAPMIAAHSVEDLYARYKEFGMHAEADALNEAMRETNAEAMTDMKVISTSVEIPREQVDAFFDAMLEGNATDVLARIAQQFLPDREELEAQLRDLANKVPLSYMMTHTIKDEVGRTVAVVGPVDQDFEGQLVRHVSKHLSISSIWLRETVQRGLDRGLISAEALLDFVLDCPLFREARRAILETGVDAYVRGDSLIAIHLLVPQVEQAIRQLAIAVDAPIYTLRRGGGVHVRTLDDLLRDEKVGAAVSGALGDGVLPYFRILLTDARGWNVRNTVCHGLAPVDALTMPVADRVVHVALILSLLRTEDPVRHDGEQPPEDVEAE